MFGEELTSLIICVNILNGGLIKDIDCLQVEPEGEVLVEPQSILYRREVRLRKRVITQVRVPWQHYGPEKATWEDEELIRKTYPHLFNERRHRDDVQS